jgi:uncharacterized membrane protein
MVATQVPYRTSKRRMTKSSQRQRGGADRGVNVGDTERWASLAGGGLLALYGLSRGNWLGFGLAAAGASLVYRGLTGHCGLYSSLGVNTSEPHSPQASVAAARGVKVVRAVTINRSPEEVYRAWRNFEKLPSFMQHLNTVTVQGNRSHWTAKAPAGMSVEWDAEIINDKPNHVIAWRSLEGSQVSTAGSVHFTPAPGGRGTEVLVELKYDLPAGKLGSWFAWLFGEEPSVQVREDLRRFKQLLEA